MSQRIKRALKLFGQKLLKDEILLFAQGLTYNTLLTLIPLLGLIISLGRSFLQEEALIQQSFTFFSNYLTAEALINVMEKIISLLENLKKFPLGKFSLLFYFMMSLGLLFQIEDVLNRIFLSFTRRSFKERLLFYWIALTFAPFIFFLPLLIQASLKSFQAYQIVLYFFFLLFFFFLIYIYFPARRVSKVAALVGSSFATFLWFFFSFSFGIYVKKAVAYSKLYGSLSIFPIFVIFLFLNWLIFLLGAEISYAFERRPWQKRFLLLHSPFKEFLILLKLSQNFYQGRVLTLEGLYRELPLTEEELLFTLKDLEKKGLLLLKDEEVFFRLPPEQIKLSQVFHFSELLELERGFPELASLLDLCPFKKEDLFGKSLKDLLFS